MVKDYDGSNKIIVSCICLLVMQLRQWATGDHYREIDFRAYLGNQAWYEHIYGV